MKLSMLLTLLVLIFPSMVWAADDTLTVTQDESSMERGISRYLREHREVRVEEKEITEGDLALSVLMDGQDGPDFYVVVDTQACARDGDGKVTERAVTAEVFTGIKVPDGRRAAVSEAINGFVARMWFASIYIDEDDELACQWCVNVMKEGLPTEYVADTIIRVADSWRKFRLEAAKAINGEG
jgi:hypothetical protein